MARGLALFAGAPPGVIRTCAREAEELGYRSLWVNHPGPIDGLTALGLAAVETTRLELGIGVIPLHTRGPDSIAQGVRDHRLPLDRLLLGVGSPGPGALGRVRAGAAALRARLPVRLVVAALGPGMCRLAGEVADGVLFNWLTPEHARQSADWVRAGAAAAARPVPRLMAYVRLAVGSAAGDHLRSEGARYAAIPAYAAHFGRMGVDPLATAVVAPDAGAVPAALRRWEGVLDDVVLRLVTGGNTAEEHLAAVRAARPAERVEGSDPGPGSLTRSSP
jgi:alkanesulfonate monooxygenase SsuD/methylene tetrahydromethanopterin reductase-like flavin-dependent oxidoreductase (luciferase family)